MLMYKITPSNIWVQVQMLKRKVKNTESQGNVKEPSRVIKRSVQLKLTTKCMST